MLRMPNDEGKLRTKGKNIALQAEILRDFERFCFRHGMQQGHAASAALASFMQQDHDERARWLQHVADFDSAGAGDTQGFADVTPPSGAGQPGSVDDPRSTYQLQSPPPPAGKGGRKRRK